MNNEDLLKIISLKAQRNWLIIFFCFIIFALMMLNFGKFDKFIKHKDKEHSELQSRYNEELHNRNIELMKLTLFNDSIKGINDRLAKEFKLTEVEKAKLGINYEKIYNNIDNIHPDTLIRLFPIE